MGLRATSKDGFYGWIGGAAAYFSKAKSKDGFYGWINIAVMFFFNVALWPMMMAFTYFVPSWMKEFGWTRPSASIAQTISMILSGLAAPLVGILIMKYGTKRAIVLGNLMCVAGLLLLAHMTRLSHLYLGIGVLLGLGVSIGGMLAMMTVMNNWFIVKRPLALSLSMAAMGFSGVILSPAMWWLIDEIGWRKTYLILAVAGFIFCVLVPALLIKEKPEALGQVPDGQVSTKPESMRSSAPRAGYLGKTPVDFTAREALRTRSLWLLVAYNALTFFVMMGLGSWIIDIQTEIHIPKSLIGLIGGIFSAVMGCSQLSIGFFGLRFRMHTLAVVTMIVGIIGFSFLLFAYSLPLPMMLAYTIIYGVSAGIGSVAIGNLIPDYFGRTEFPKIMGFTMPFNTIVMGLAPLIAGYIRQSTGSYMPVFRLLFALLLVSAFCIIFAKPPVHPSLKEARTGS
jgi:MFS family permease